MGAAQNVRWKMVGKIDPYPTSPILDPYSTSPIYDPLPALPHFTEQKWGREFSPSPFLVLEMITCFPPPISGFGNGGIEGGVIIYKFSRYTSNPVLILVNLELEK